MHELDFLETVKKICDNDPRYSMEAYIFIRETLDFTAKTMDKPVEGPERHMTGQELLEGIRAYSLQEFGPMALTVLNTWGIKTAGDFGEIVFNLVNSGILGKTDEDKIEDFMGGYEFFEAFAQPFLPESPLKRKNVESRTVNKRRPVKRKKGKKN